MIKDFYCQVIKIKNLLNLQSILQDGWKIFWLQQIVIYIFFFSLKIKDQMKRLNNTVYGESRKWKYKK